MLRVLVACEFSGTVRNAFVRAGHDAFSCDLLPSETERPDGWDGHYQGDVLELLDDPSYGFDLMIAHPPCTYLSGSGLHWNRRIAGRPDKTADAIAFTLKLWAAKIQRICIENPVGILTGFIDRFPQYIQPYDFGHDASKKTGLWLKNLPPLVPTKHIEPRSVILNGKAYKRWANQTDSGQNRLGPSPTRSQDRARTYQGIAEAMASQWGKLD